MRVGELPPAAGADQLPVTPFAPHPQTQGLAFLIDLGLVDSVTRSSQDFREIAASHSAESSRNTSIVETLGISMGLYEFLLRTLFLQPEFKTQPSHGPSLARRRAPQKESGNESSPGANLPC